jgi:hypothetical protein
MSVEWNGARLCGADVAYMLSLARAFLAPRPHHLFVRAAAFSARKLASSSGFWQIMSFTLVHHYLFGIFIGLWI